MIKLTPVAFRSKRPSAISKGFESGESISGPVPPTAWQRVIVFAVHPDDEALSTGGLIQEALARGADVRIVFVTDGDNNPWPQRWIERRWFLGEAARARWGKRRRREAIESLACLGLPEENISFWNYPDQGLTRILLSGRAEFVARLSHYLGESRPTLVVAPAAHDLHPDHNAFAVLLDFASARNGWSQQRPFVLFGYLVHGCGKRPRGNECQIPLSPERVAIKQKAILCHATQMALSRRRFLGFARDRESFSISNHPGASDQLQRPVSAKVDGQWLALRLGRGAVPGGVLLIAAESSKGPVRQVIRFQGRRLLSVSNPTTGRLLGGARQVRDRGFGEILLPQEWFGPVSNLWVKSATDWGFYDRAGWQHIAVEPAFSACLPEIEVRRNNPRICCVVPCYNLSDICGPIVRDAARFAKHVIAVNDGSNDATELILDRIAGECEGRVTVLSLPHNRGKGIALLKAFREAVETAPFDVLVTMDGDGQHRPEDIPRLARAVASGETEMAIGERSSRADMP